MRSEKVKKTTARRIPQGKILIWKGYSGGPSRPCISTEACAGRTHGPRRFSGWTHKPVVAKRPAQPLGYEPAELHFLLQNQGQPLRIH